MISEQDAFDTNDPTGFGASALNTQQRAKLPPELEQAK
jgi:hypothetical protein